MKKLLLTCFALAIALYSAAQERTVTGRVTAVEDGSGLPGVNVIVKSTTNGTVTDSDGNYSLSVPSEGILVFSFIGLRSKEVEIGSQSVVNVQMDMDVTQLTEVVVTGVGTPTDKKKVAIAVQSVSAENLSKVPSASLDQALIGKVAGAQIQSISGQPGQQASILLRGINSFNGSNTTQPMILVDGIQVNAGNNNNGSSTNVSSRLADLDLSNVERVEVIQGAAAATIYGAQGANGVIQIFTKKGQRNERTRIDVSTRYSVDNPLKGNLELAKYHAFNTDAEGYILTAPTSSVPATRISHDENGIWTQPEQPVVTGTTLNNKPYMEQIYDHVDQLFKNNVATINNTLGISGGGGKYDYAINISRLDQESVLNGKYNRNNLTLNLGADVFKGFSVRSSTQIIYSENNTGGITGANNVTSGLGTAINSPGWWDMKFIDTKGNYVFNQNPAIENVVNPFYNYQFRSYSANTTRIIQNVSLNYKLPKFVEFDYKYGIDNYRYDFEDFAAYQKNTATPAYSVVNGGGRITYNRDNETLQNSLFTVFVRTDFAKDFNMDLPITTSTHFAYDYRKRMYKNITTQGSDFAPFPPYTMNTTASKSATENNTEFVTFGYLINQKVDYGELFGLSGGVRVDYSSAFGAGSKAFVFPRGDAYFRLGELLKSNSIFEFKLRAAYGEAGVQPQAYDRFVILNSGSIGTGGYLAVPSGARNPNLDVQVSKETEFGTDIGLSLGSGNWLQRITLGATYWKRKAENSIYDIAVAPSTGSSTIRDNAFTLDGKGFEFALDAHMYSSANLTWDFGTRFGKQQTIVEEISNHRDVVIGSSGSGQFVLREGATVGAFFGKRPLRNLQEVGPTGARYIAEADESLYTIVNGMVVNKSTKAVMFTSDQTQIGDPTPKFNMSFINNFTVKNNLTISFQFDWMYGNDIYNLTRQWLYRDRRSADFDKSVTVGEESGAFVAYYNSLYNTNQVNSYFVEKGSFLRLRDLSVGYNLAPLFNNKILRNAQITFSGRNLFTITDYSGMDPEASANLNDPLRRGADLYSFPNFRSYQVGLNLGF
ncbi:SusC/RagA family TonB-linked outer membrane protein [Fulvivirgaceae bacterium PWU4]|uniref:SusC/RagA family TonB-linked outer membrane protein n=1 Tax=Chryseosolibacter histidini TaxID=2782349 RepID=A0AAP2GKE2_9BACT|nr:SusC/RagA family TonB-linked outer membrane protein [Chryseosolibacter histidini]MBT1698949.1 SusC/RagA family TonB-linked outer membrane protein [Chryseosolibacter histidini]